MDSDAELMRRAIAGDDAAFSEVVKRHIDSVFSFLLRYSGSDAIAEDATQETFVKAWRAIQKFNPERSLRPWLFEIARNAANDLLRKKRARTFSELSRKESDTQFEDTLADPSPLPPELFEIAELGEHVATALATLPERDRAILVLRYVEELPWDDIATAMSAPANTVKSWHRRALIGLRNSLAPFAPNGHDRP